MRTWLILLALGGALLACRGGEQQPTSPAPMAAVERPRPRPFRIAVLGDRTGGPDDAVFRQALDRIARLEPDLVVSVGDLINGFEPDERMEDAEAEWDRVLGMVHGAIGRTPFVAAPGNHDVWSPASEALFARRLGHGVNHSLDAGPARLILLDTSRARGEPDLPGATLDWLWRELRAARDSAARIVVTHRPLFALPGGGAPGTPLHDVLIAGRADFLFAGHWHHSMADERDGIAYRLLGPSGAALNRPGHPETGNFQQVSLVTIDGAVVEHSIIAVDGVHDADEFSYEKNQLEWKIANQAVAARGFFLDGLAPASQGAFDLQVTNVTEAPLKGVLRLADPAAGWRLRPAAVEISLAPGRSLTKRMSFTRGPGTAAFPGPRVALGFPWIGGGTYDLGAELSPTRVRRIPELSGPVTLDGRPDEPVWARAADLGPLLPSDGDKMGAARVRAFVSNRVLHVAVEIAEPDMAGQILHATARDSFVFDEDAVAVLVDANPKEPGHAIVGVSAAGGVYDRLEGTGRSAEEETGWNGPEQAAVSRAAGAWSAEIALPLSALGVEASARRLAFNVGRGRVRPAGPFREDWQPPGEHDATRFGVLVLPR